jgi:hypothetical protein
MYAGFHPFDDPTDLCVAAGFVRRCGHLFRLMTLPIYVGIASFVNAGFVRRRGHLFRYAWQKGQTEGDTIKLFAATEESIRRVNEPRTPKGQAALIPKTIGRPLRPRRE